MPERKPIIRDEQGKPIIWDQQGKPSVEPGPNEQPQYDEFGPLTPVQADALRKSRYWWWQCDTCLMVDANDYVDRASARRAATRHADHEDHDVQIGGPG